MISKHVFDELSKFGQFSSWAIWAPAGDKPKQYTDDMRVFDDPDLLSKLNSDYIFVGLNASRPLEGSTVQLWNNFHSPDPRQNDYKLRYAF